VNRHPGTIFASVSRINLRCLGRTVRPTFMMLWRSLKNGCPGIVFLAVASRVDVAQRVAELVRRHGEVRPLNLVTR